MRYDFTLTGTNALLLHADDVVQADRLDGWRKDPANQLQSVRGDDRSPAWTWSTYLHFDNAAGEVAIPQDLISAAIRHAGAKMPLSGKTTYKSLTQSGLLIETEYCRLLGPNGPIKKADIDKIVNLSFAEQAEAVQKMGFTLFVKRAKVGQAKHVRVRPRFNAWTVTGTVEIIDPDFKPAKLKECFEIAGRKAGLGDWRPSSKIAPGPFGSFSAELKPSS